MTTKVRSLEDEVADRLRRSGFRYTAQRRRLIDLLVRSGDPITIGEIVRRDRRLPQSSAYRNLSDLESAGVVRRVVTAEGSSRYELAEDLTGHHHHLVCASCGSTTDIELGVRLERALDAALDELARHASFADISHRLDLIGTCASCAARAGHRATG